MSHQTTRPAKRGGPQILSTVLFVAALGFAAAAVYLWYMDDAAEPNEPAVPTAEAGRYELVTVLGALEAGGLEADFGRTTARSDQLDQPGQNLQVEDTNVYVFFFSGPDTREAAFAGLDPATMTLTTPSGADVGNGQPLSAYAGANVIAVLIGGDDALRAQVREIIEGLP